MTARLFASLGRNLVLEFVPREDSQVQRMLATRKDIFESYTLDRLLEAYKPYFTLGERREIPGSARSLLLFTAKNRNSLALDHYDTPVHAAAKTRAAGKGLGPGETTP
jgi:hypothetical protein